ARQSIFDYIERFYNRQRIHTSIGNQPPMEFEQQLEAFLPVH
ncbi:MAG TPA: IS3 family transposase, partial [Syntrophales bacterium]|nr:IS3 family transposase [Syntrophales bacterium]